MFAREEKDIIVFLRRVLVNVALVAASPFLMLAFLFFLLQKPLVWSLVPLAIALLLLVAFGVIWLVVRARLRAARTAIEWVADSPVDRPPL